MGLRRTLSNAAQRARGAVGGLIGRLRRPAGEAVATGHGGAVLRTGMWVRPAHDPGRKPLRITDIPRRTAIELDFGDGVRDVMVADLYVPARRRRR